MKNEYKLFRTTFLLICCLFFSSCSGTAQTELNKPIGVFAVGNTIVWNKVTKAAQYEIYQGQTLIDTTENNYYCAGDLENDLDYAIKATNKEDGYKSSKLSESVTLFRNVGFLVEEIQNITLKSNTVYEISVDYKKVILTMPNGLSSVDHVQIKILPRDNDLTIELSDVSIYGSPNEPTITTYNNSVSYNSSPYTINFVLDGDNKIYGGSANGMPDKPSTNSNTDGLKGYAGRDAILLSHVNFTGNGNLSLYGGDGGTGGTGSDSSGLSTAIYGSGGNGGDGGNGLNCSKFVLNIDSTKTLTAIGGDGGSGGSPGSNGSVLTGPAMTADWANRFGKDGYNGLAFSGTEFKISGQKSSQ